MTTTRTTPVTGPEAVRLAIEHLDRVAPEGWRDRIDLDALNLTSLQDCVLGQIYRRSDTDYRGYGHGMVELREAPGGDPSWFERYDENVYAADRDYLDEWRRQLGKQGSTRPTGITRDEQRRRADENLTR
jgi:hypothetical protein